jgi:two-component system sensor histidine kinase YesM
MAIKEKNNNLANHIKALANHFKHALNEGKEMTTIGEEVKHIEDYLMIQKNRFGDVLKVDISVQQDIQEYSVLNLILQPLVENAIIHGLEKKLGNWELSVNIWEKQDVVYFEVKENGMGVDEVLINAKMQATDGKNDALALNNVNKRIKYKYGEDSGLQFNSQIGIGTRVLLRIPISSEDS